MRRAATELARAVFAAVVFAILFVVADAVASGVGASAAARLLGAALGDRLTLTSTSGDALTCTGAATNGDGVDCTSAGTGSGVYGKAGASGGVGVTAEQTGAGYALALNGDTTSPAWAHLKFSQNNANPVNGAFGDLAFVLSGSVIQFRTFTASSTWNSLSGIVDITTAYTAFAGGGQASATAICARAELATVTTVATAADSVKFPATPVLGQICEVWNKGANSMNLFPGSGDVLCVTGGACLAANTATAIAANASLRCVAESAATWDCR